MNPKCDPNAHLNLIGEQTETVQREVISPEEGDSGGDAMPESITSQVAAESVSPTTASILDDVMFQMDKGHEREASMGDGSPELSSEIGEMSMWSEVELPPEADPYTLEGLYALRWV